ncbi:MAG: Mur ligase family protein, partial [Bacteroidota bacterium]
LCVITNISFDHKDLLGDTLQKIAIEKAGIIKQNIPVVIGESQSETKNVFIQKAKQQTAPIVFADEYFKVSENNYSEFEQTLTVTAENKSKEYTLDLSGNYQQKNICTLLAALTELRKQNFKITDEQIHQALSNTKQITGFRGRWEILNTQPLIIADVGHNEAGIKEVMQQIHSLKKESVHFVLGMVGDKDRKNILLLLPKNFIYYLCKPNIPRGLNEKILFEEATAIGLKGNYFPSVKSAYDEAKKNASENDLIFIGGSTFVVAEII